MYCNRGQLLVNGREKAVSNEIGINMYTHIYLWENNNFKVQLRSHLMQKPKLLIVKPVFYEYYISSTGPVYIYIYIQNIRCATSLQGGGRIQFCSSFHHRNCYK